MIKFAQLTDSPFAYEFLRQLKEASIRASMTESTPVSDIYTGLPAHVEIWIERESDVKKARQIYHEVYNQQTASACPSCGYDMRGHSGTVNCPECGQPLTTLTRNIQCGGCGEDVPANFEICWNCGRDKNKKPPADRG